ncbi:hypothetical protein N431DRAFT_485649 [Stipitochalara longipes BDJ]|nr:hypothetical protein N431DRAFT_485649 [Stipitochalara longipes BDJ]
MEGELKLNANAPAVRVDHEPWSNAISMISQLSLKSHLSLISTPSRRITGISSLADVQDLDTTPAALSLFVLETCNRQLRQYHLSALDERAVNLNIGEGLDYSVDISKTDGGELVAVKHQKVVAEDQSDDDADRRSSECSRIWKALEEIQIMMHPPIAECINVLSVEGFGWDYVGGKTTTPALVVEFAKYGTLRHYLTSEPKKSDTEKWRVLSGVIEGLSSLHRCGIVHGDVKMENILVVIEGSDRVTPKIADFGSSIITTSEKEYHSYGGTDIYNPPEVRLGGGSISRLSLVYCDLWAFGLLSLEVALGGHCYLDEENSRCFNSPVMEGLEASCLRRLNQAHFDDLTVKSKFRGVVEKALKREPVDRETSQAMKDYFLEDLEELDHINMETREDEKLFKPHYDAESSIIDLADCLTMRAILKGRGTSTFSPEKLPWSVQVEIAERYKNISSLQENVTSGYAHLNLAICYYLGLGVERNPAKVGEHIHASALRGTPQARLIIHPLSELLGFDIRTHELQAVKDPDNDEELDIILAAMKQKPYRTPFRELLHLRSRRLSRLEVRPEELHLAVVFDNFEATKNLLESGVTDSPNDNGQTALLLSCQYGNFQVAKLLLEYGSDPLIADENGYTPLHLLCMFQDEDISPLCRLIQVTNPNVDVEAFSSIPYFPPDFWDALVGTPLQWATAAGNLKAVEALLALGASPTNYPAWFSPIQIASYLLLPEILEILVEKSTPTPAIEDNGLFFLNEAHPFRQIMIHGEELPKAIERTVQKLSSDRGVDISAPWGTTPLMKVALTNISTTDVIIVRELLKRCNTQIDGPQFSTIQAGIQGCNGSLSESLSEITLMLIDAGFSTRAVSSNDGSWPGWNAMHWAAAGTSLEIVERLFNRDPELLQIQTSFETKDTPLHIAARASYGLEMVRLLLRLGADPCAEAGYGQFPLANCIGESRLQLDMQKFDLLLEANAVNGYVVQNNGSTILHHVALRAARLSQEDLPGHELLRHVLNRSELSGLINKKNDKGITPLHLVCYRPDYTSIRLLVEAGADFYLRTPEPEGLGPLEIVLEHARVPLEGFAGKDLGPVWHKFAYRAACYLADCTAGTPQDLKLTRLHIAAYCGYTEEVKKLVEQENADLYAKTATGFTPLETLYRLLLQYHQTRTIINLGYLRRAQEVMRYLLSQQQINVESQ